jgi:glycosyltransferase involved in cell wall biosynthesis
LAPLVTIGLPVWNAGRFLEATLRSIFAQTVTDWELVAVDDGSADDSLALLQRLKDPRVRVIADGKHLGLAARLNQIIGLAQGEFLARMDADDLMHPQRLEKQLARLRSDPRADVVGCGMVILDKEGHPVGARRLPESHEEITRDVVRQTSLAHATALARTEWWRKFRYDETAPLGVEDWRFWIEAASGSRFANLPELLYYYREFDSFRVGNYIANRFGLMDRLWSLPQISSGRAARESVRHIGLAAAFSIFAPLGLRDALISRRNEALSDEEKCDFEKAMAVIDVTRVS